MASTAYDVHRYNASEMQQMPDSYSSGFVFPNDGDILSKHPICGTCGIPITNIQDTVIQRGWRVHPGCKDGVK